MTDFPRGWTLTSQQSAGVAATLTVPATAGVVHVLDSFFARLTATSAAAAATVCSVLTGTNVLGQFAYPGGALGSDEATLNGLDLATAPGAALTVAFNVVTPANYVELLIIQGHDI